MPIMKRKSPGLSCLAYALRLDRRFFVSKFPLYPTRVPPGEELDRDMVRRFRVVGPPAFSRTKRARATTVKTKTSFGQHKSIAVGVMLRSHGGFRCQSAKTNEALNNSHQNHSQKEGCERRGSGKGQRKKGTKRKGHQ